MRLAFLQAKRAALTLIALPALLAAPCGAASPMEDSLRVHAPAVAGSPRDPIDAFLAGALGLTPFVSGLYLTDRPARGVLFTGVDLLAAMGIYTARYSAQGRPDYARGYFIVMAANNLLDAFISSRYARTSSVPRALVLPAADGGVTGALHWTF